MKRITAGAIERGATAVEYALGLGCVVAVLFGAIGAFQEAAADRYEDRQGSIAADPYGAPDTPGPTVVSTTTSSTSTSIVYSITKSCGNGSNANLCTFTIVPAVSATWSISSTSHSAAGSSTTYSFAATGSYTVTATVGAHPAVLGVTCTKPGQHIQC